MRVVAKSSGVTLEMENNIPIAQVTKQAFIQLGDNGVIKCAQNHSCSECTHKYKETADRITAGDDPAAVLGVDENHQVPALVGEGAELAIQDAAQARLNAQLAAQARSNADDARMLMKFLKVHVQLMMLMQVLKIHLHLKKQVMSLWL